MERVQSAAATREDGGVDRRQVDGTAADRLVNADELVFPALRRADALAAIEGMVQLRATLRMFGQEHQLPEGFVRVQAAFRSAVDGDVVESLPLLTEGGHE